MAKTGKRGAYRLSLSIALIRLFLQIYKYSIKKHQAGVEGGRGRVVEGAYGPFFACIRRICVQSRVVTSNIFSIADERGGVYQI